MAQTASQAQTTVLLIGAATPDPEGGTGQEEPEVLPSAGEDDRREDREVSWAPSPDCDAELMMEQEYQQWKLDHQGYWDGWALLSMGVFIGLFGAQFTCLVVALLRCGGVSTLQLLVCLFYLCGAVYVPKRLSQLAR